MCWPTMIVPADSIASRHSAAIALSPRSSSPRTRLRSPGATSPTSLVRHSTMLPPVIACWQEVSPMTGRTPVRSSAIASKSVATKSSAPLFPEKPQASRQSARRHAPAPIAAPAARKLENSSMHLVSRKPAESAPPRIGKLAKLPVFFDLAGKRAIVAGGTAAAAWKCELLAAAGAHVDVYAEVPGPEMTACLASATDNAITHHARTWNAQTCNGQTCNAQIWTPDIFAGAAIAIGDFENDSEAAAFAKAAEGAGVPVNIIDRPAFSQFQFGSIVNRSPVIIGISTDGAAPILGQTIRRRIETLVPPWLAQWGALARELRATVMERLAKGAPRRRFWERFGERAFAAAPAIIDRNDLVSLVD